MAKASEKQGNTEPQQSKIGGFGFLDLIRVLGGVLLLNCGSSWFVTGNSITWGWRPWFSRPDQLQAWWRGPIYLTDEELTAYDGTDPTKPIYVALNGTIYDVSAGPRHYGPGGSYHFFAGHDGARAFITGCFDTDITPDVRGVEEMYVPTVLDIPDDAPKETKREAKLLRERAVRLGKEKVRRGIAGWQRTFSGETGRPYFEVGKVKREPDWLEKLPKRQLCDSAKNSRPKTMEPKKGKTKADKYRSGI